MNQRWRRWAPVLAAALGFAVLAWLVTSASLSGHRLVTPGGVPAGVPPEAAEYLPDSFYENFPPEADLGADAADDLPPGLLDDLGNELSASELAALSGVLSDDLLIELAKDKAGELSPGELQELWDGLDSETRERLLDEIGGTYTQEELDQFADRLSPELYEELSERAEPEENPIDEPTGDTQPSSDDTDSSATEPAESSRPEPTEAEPTASDAAKDEETRGQWDWLKDLGEFALLAVKWLLIAAVAALAVYLLFRLISALTGWRPRRRAKTAPVAPPAKPDEPEEPGPEVDKLREALAEGLSDVAEAADPRVGVIECWERLERAAAAAGLPRLASETPGELVARVLTAAKVDAEALNGLADTYRRARYGPHEIGEDLRQRAVAALAAVDEQLAASAANLESV